MPNNTLLSFPSVTGTQSLALVLLPSSIKTERLHDIISVHN